MRTPTKPMSAETRLGSILLRYLVKGERQHGEFPAAERTHYSLCVIAKPVQRPNDTRVRGAGPARKTVIRPKACKAPHPLQPIFWLPQCQHTLQRDQSRVLLLESADSAYRGITGLR
jgi:hypothetical protein